MNADGVANVPVLAPKLKTLDEVRSHALMIHSAATTSMIILLPSAAAVPAWPAV